MASGRDDLADRLDDLESAVEALLDEHAAARARLHDLETVVTGGAPAERGRPADERTGAPGERQQAVESTRPAPEEEATQAEVERAVQEVELEDGEERDEEFIVA